LLSLLIALQPQDASAEDAVLQPGTLAARLAAAVRALLPSPRDKACTADEVGGCMLLVRQILKLYIRLSVCPLTVACAAYFFFRFILLLGSAYTPPAGCDSYTGCIVNVTAALATCSFLLHHHHHYQQQQQQQQ
jgi:hypothetical protein